MKNLGIPCLLATFLLFMGSCTKKEKTYTRLEMQHIVDSIVKEKASALNQQAKEDLKLRLPIELKPKLDSLTHQHSVISLPPVIDTSNSIPTVPTPLETDSL